MKTFHFSFGAYIAHFGQKHHVFQFNIHTIYIYIYILLICSIYLLYLYIYSIYLIYHAIYSLYSLLIYLFYFFILSILFHLVILSLEFNPQVNLCKYTLRTIYTDVKYFYKLLSFYKYTCVIDTHTHLCCITGCDVNWKLS